VDVQNSPAKIFSSRGISSRACPILKNAKQQRVIFFLSAEPYFLFPLKKVLIYAAKGILPSKDFRMEIVVLRWE
jgi:hypothetical protein